MQCNYTRPVTNVLTLMQTGTPRLNFSVMDGAL